jgi:hypothetical protein
MRRALSVLIVSALAAALTSMPLAPTPGFASQAPQQWDAARGLLIEGATVVTMDDRHTVVPHGSVLVRDGRIVAVWSGPQPPGQACADREGEPRTAGQPGPKNHSRHTRRWRACPVVAALRPRPSPAYAPPPKIAP